MVNISKKTGAQVTCDLCGNVCRTSETTAREARWQAKSWGWKRGPVGHDICDMCLEERKERDSWLVRENARLAVASL